jgi:fumarylpyruvate hydrolase
LSTELSGGLVLNRVPPVRAPVAGISDCYPIRRVYCVGRNYAAHVREMGGNEREPPFFFQKPSDSVVLDRSTVAYPAATRDFQHEVELVLAIGRAASHIAPGQAREYVYGCAVGIDLTRRDLQIAARNSGRPWEAGKSFDASAPLGVIKPLVERALPSRGAILLAVNGAVRQRGDLSEMIWSPDEIVSQLSDLYRLEPGDLVYTGTPSGVGALQRGDSVRGEIEGVGSVEIDVV